MNSLIGIDVVSEVEWAFASELQTARTRAGFFSFESIGCENKKRRVERGA